MNIGLPTFPTGGSQAFLNRSSLNRYSHGGPFGSPKPINWDPASLNAELQSASSSDVLSWVFANAERPILTTNFRPHAIALIDLAVAINPDLPVVWVDHGFNTHATYEYVEDIKARLKLQLRVYTPRISAARYRALNGDVPSLHSKAHAQFTEDVKLEPFSRALDELAPDFWITGIRKDQTAFRSSLDTFSHGRGGIIRVAPFINLTEADVVDYIEEKNLPNYSDYFDPTKGRSNRECGLQTMT